MFSTSPDAEVVFFPFENEITYDAKKAKTIIPSGSFSLLNVKQISVRKDIISLSTNKPKSGVGTFQLQLSSNQNYKRMIHPGCWCLIYFSDQSLSDLSKDYGTTEKSGFKMLGIVRTVRRQEYLNPETGTKTIRYMIAGEDFQSIFNVPIYVNKNLAAVGNESPDNVRMVGLARLELSQLRPGANPSVMVETLITNLIGTPGYKNKGVKPLGLSKTGIPVQLPKQISKILLGEFPPNTEFLSTLTLLIQKNTIGLGEFQPDIGGVVPAWSIIQTYAHRLLNELYTEILPVDFNGKTRLVPSIVFRSIPFSSYDVKANSSQIYFLDATGQEKGARLTASRDIKKARKAVPRRSTEQRKSKAGEESHFYVSMFIREDEILAFDLGKSDKERFNFFFVTPSLLNQVNKVFEDSILGLIAAKGFDKIGDSGSIARYGLRPFVSQSNYQLGATAQAMNETIKDLWINSHLYENGQVTLIGQHNHIPVGTNVEFHERGWVGHVEMVSHHFTVSPEGKKSYYTTLALSRLQLVNGQPIDAVELKEPFRDWERGMTTTNPEAPAFSNELIESYDKLKGQA